MRTELFVRKQHELFSVGSMAGGVANYKILFGHILQIRVVFVYFNQSRQCPEVSNDNRYALEKTTSIARPTTIINVQYVANSNHMCVPHSNRQSCWVFATTSVHHHASVRVRIRRLSKLWAHVRMPLVRHVLPRH